tara:strand:+ start:796 stop:1017 length:222 start_codon:yes stop_codon:yes gene_type:complete
MQIIDLPEFIIDDIRMYAHPILPHALQQDIINHQFPEEIELNDVLDFITYSVLTSTDIKISVKFNDDEFSFTL